MTPKTLKRVEELNDKWANELLSGNEFNQLVHEVMDHLPDLLAAVKERNNAEVAFGEFRREIRELGEQRDGAWKEVGTWRKALRKAERERDGALANLKMKEEWCNESAPAGSVPQRVSKAVPGQLNRTMSKTLNQITDAVHQNAWDKGWHDENETEDHFVERSCNNLHDEISELHEAWRNNSLRDLCDKADKMAAMGLPPLTCIEEEFADIMIRVLDNCRKLGVDIERAIEIKHRFNTSRPHRHGGKRS